MKKDMMQSFELFQPRDLDGAVELLDRWGERGWAIAGGYDSLDWFKDRIKTPDAVIDLDGIEELRGIRETEDGIEIGALTTLTEVERSPMVRERYGLLGDHRFETPPRWEETSAKILGAGTTASDWPATAPAVIFVMRTRRSR